MASACAARGHECEPAYPILQGNRTAKISRSANLARTPVEKTAVVCCAQFTGAGHDVAARALCSRTQHVEEAVMHSVIAMALRGLCAADQGA